jgi:hypothetical protein
MPARNIPAAVFLPSEAEPAIVVPGWWPNDKHLVLVFRAPTNYVMQGHGGQEQIT